MRWLRAPRRSDVAPRRVPRPSPVADVLAPGAKVFGIGLNKTGTISLHEALETLGFRSLHWGGPGMRDIVLGALAAGRPLVDDLPQYDAFSDIWGLSQHFALLDEQYPGSRFVLTTRDVESWVASRRKHVERNRERRARGLYDGTFLEIDPDRWREQYAEHHASVRRYFAGRDDLLELRITEGEGYELLCPFLGVPHPGLAFPTRHRATAPGTT